MPRVFGNKYRSALLKRVTHIVEDENSAALQNVEGLVHVEMSLDGDTCTNHHLLCTQGEILGTRGGANLNEDVPVVAKMNEMFAFSCAKHISLRGSSTDLSDGSSYSGYACSLQKAATAMLDVHGSSFGQKFYLRDMRSVAAIMAAESKRVPSPGQYLLPGLTTRKRR